MTNHVFYIAQILDNFKTGLPEAKATPDTLTTALNIAFAIMGAVAFLMLVIAGLRYTLSQGDPTKTADAKRMITYSLVGLLVISLAATIVNFVLNKA